MKICTVGECDRPVLAKGVCNKHYHDMRRLGEFRPHRPVDRVCERRDCGRPYMCRGLCEMHYDQVNEVERRMRTTGNGAMWPIHTSPFRPLAQSCHRCGHLVTATDLSREAAAPACPNCEKPKYPERWSAYYQQHSDAYKTRAVAHTRAVQREALEVATNHGAVWTGPELELIVDGTRTARELAQMLGRSLFAVRSAQRRCREEPAVARRAGLTTKSYLNA